MYPGSITIPPPGAPAPGLSPAQAGEVRGAGGVLPVTVAVDVEAGLGSSIVIPW